MWEIEEGKTTWGLALGSLLTMEPGEEKSLGAGGGGVYRSQRNSSRGYTHTRTHARSLWMQAVDERMISSQTANKQTYRSFGFSFLRWSFHTIRIGVKVPAQQGPGETPKAVHR